MGRATLSPLQYTHEVGKQQPNKTNENKKGKCIMDCISSHYSCTGFQLRYEVMFNVRGGSNVTKYKCLVLQTKQGSLLLAHLLVRSSFNQWCAGMPCEYYWQSKWGGRRWVPYKMHMRRTKQPNKTKIKTASVLWIVFFHITIVLDAGECSVLYIASS